MTELRSFGWCMGVALLTTLGCASSSKSSSSRSIQGKPEHAELGRLAEAEHKRLEALKLELQRDGGPRGTDPDAVELEKRERKLVKGERKRLLELEAKAKAAMGQ